MSLEKALKAARYFGAEVAANQGSSIRATDREDIADYYGVARWSDISEEDRDNLVKTFYEGLAAERKNYS